MDFQFKETYNISDLLEIMKILRSENGCPWDKVQTHESIRSDLIEETLEVCEGIDENSPEMLREELGDLLMQVVFHAEIESEQNRFDFGDICDGICKKLIYRHPHVFGEVKAENEDEVLKNWDALKKKSKNEETFTQTLEDVTKTLPALMKADKVCRRAARAGICRENAEELVSELTGELETLRKTFGKDVSADESEGQRIIGRLLFKICLLDKILKIDSEKALTYEVKRFVSSFAAVEKEIAAQGNSFEGLSPEELKRAAEKVFSGL